MKFNDGSYPNPIDYFADVSRISASMLGVFRRSRKLYYHKYIAQSLPNETTARLDLGSACHVAILEPDRLNQAVTVAPDVDRRTKAGRAEWDEFVTANKGLLVLKPEEFETVERCRDAVMACKLARELVEAEGPVEKPLTWVDDSGLKCKAKPDKCLKGQQTVLDLKTTSDASVWGFEGSVGKYNYGVQAAHYLEATWSNRFVWLVVAIQPPYEVALYELDQEGMDRSQAIHRRTMDELAVAYATENWHLEPTEIRQIRLPNWVV